MPQTEQSQLLACARINRLKSDPANVAEQLLALTRISDWARVRHRDNFDGYLVAAAEILSRPSEVLAGDVERERPVEGEVREMVERLRNRADTLERLGRENRPLTSEYDVATVVLTRDHLRDAAALIERLATTAPEEQSNG